MKLFEELFPIPLLEAQQYDNMFQDIFTAVDKAEEMTETNEFNFDILKNKIKTDINNVIKSAKKHLKKQDRIIWYLRWWKIYYLDQLEGEFHKRTNINSQPLIDLYTKNRDNFSKKSKLSLSDIVNETEKLNEPILVNLEHMLSLPIPEIQNHVFSYETITELFLKFYAAEEEWKKENNSSFEPDDGSEIVMEFPQNMAWVLLNKASCSKEAKAMGHCGNSPRSYSNDNIISLRKIVKRGDKTFHNPYLTFILDQNGLLGEMKGRGNEKPSEKYHPYIVALLKSPIVKGIKGGGYLPENNFSINDLDEDLKDQLLDEKPELGGLRLFYDRYGMNEQVLDMVYEMLHDSNMSMQDGSYDENTKAFTIETWSNIEDFAREVEDEPVQYLLDLIEDPAAYIEFELDNITETMIYDAIDDLPTDLHDKLLEMLDVTPVPHNETIPHMRSVEEATSRFMKSSLMDELEKAANKNLPVPDDLITSAKDRLKEYLQAGYHASAMSAYYVILDPDDEYGILDSDVELMIDEDDLINLLDTDEDDEGSYYRSMVENYGWAHIDYDYMSDFRKEKDLSLMHDKKDKEIDNLTKVSSVNLSDIMLSMAKELFS